MITKEEQDVIHHYVLLTIARKVIEFDLHTLNKSSLKLKEMYAHVLHQVLDEVSKELAVMKRFMHQRHLKVTNINNDGMFTHYQYVCRGYEGTRSYLNDHLKNMIQSYIGAYVQIKGKEKPTSRSG